MKDTALKVSAIIFLLVSTIHLLRLILKVEITVANFAIPLWFSILGFIAPLLLSIWILSLLKKTLEKNGV